MPEFQRQVVIPNVQKYSQALLALAKDPESEFDLKSQSTSVVYEAVQRANEVAIVPELCAAGCMLAQQLAQTCGKLSTPYVSQLFVAITHQLEQNITTELRTRLLKAIPPILANTHNPAPSASYNRLAAQVLRVLSPLLPSSRTYSSIRTPQESAKGKKRARYEGDELFSSNSLSGSTNLQSPANSELDTAALFALAMLRPTLPLTTQTTIHRTLLALLLYLPRTGNARRLTQEISRVYACALGEGSSGTLGIGVKALKGVEETYDLPFIPGTDHHHILQQFLHPRVPPNSKSGPAIDDILLFWKDEEEEEAKEFRQTAAILTAKNISASKLVSETFHDSNEVDHMMKGQGAEMPNLGQNDVANGVNMPEPFATASASQPSFQPIMPPVAPTELKSAAPAATPTRITSSAPPESTGAIPASSLFRTPEALNTNQASHSPALITGSFSLQPSVPDDDDEPMPQIDLDSDTDDEA
ncbi:RIX1 domain protein, partial [Rhizoctonia solani AG-3 Rhs1AP]